jgi:hypothetical protein
LALLLGKGIMKLTNRQQLYKKNRIMGMDQRNAARAAGYSEAYAAQACRIERVVKVSLRDAFERAGLTDKKIVEYALEGMQANKVVSANITYGDADSKTNDFIDVPDWQVRHKFFETTLKLTDKLQVDSPVKVAINQQIVLVRYSALSPTSDNRIAKLADASDV